MNGNVLSSLEDEPKYFIFFEDCVKLVVLLGDLPRRTDFYDTMQLRLPADGIVSLPLYRHGPIKLLFT